MPNDIEQQLKDQAKFIAGVRKRDKAAAKKKKKRSEWVKRLKRDVQTMLKGSRHSPAGKRYLKSKKGK